jgi:hypothetical protein
MAKHALLEFEPPGADPHASEVVREGLRINPVLYPDSDCSSAYFVVSLPS